MARLTNPQITEEFARRTGYTFCKPALLTGALTHPSSTTASTDAYQRLEFLGDRVLGLVIAEELFKRYPDAREGDLARQLNFLVRKQTCAAVARNIDLGELIRSQVPLRGHSTVSMRILGDTCEAIIAAVYLDGGFVAAKRWVLALWEDFLDQAVTATRDAKTVLQEWSLGLGIGIPNYDVVSRTGPDHSPVFTVRVALNGYTEALGEAKSKRAAEQEAARTFIEQNGIDIQ